jgi:hypothetical protein
VRGVFIVLAQIVVALGLVGVVHAFHSGGVGECRVRLPEPPEVPPRGPWTHGHNIVAVDFGYLADAATPTAPGGTFPSAQLGCQSCHDPHSASRRLSDGSYVTTTTPT